MKSMSLRNGLCLLVLLSAGCELLIGGGMGGGRDSGAIQRWADIFRGAPASALRLQNPCRGRAQAVLAGRKLFHEYCAQCHGNNAEGLGKAPPLRSPVIQQAPEGVLFWFLKNGKMRAGMPSWSGLPPQQRWQIVSFLKSLH